MLRLPGRLDPLLRRPMSVSEVLPDEAGRPDRIRILLKVVGRGTELLAALPPGDSIQVLGPLGKPFQIPPPPAEKNGALMAAGGIGVAPFPFLANELRKAGWRPVLLFGARGEQDLVNQEWFEARNLEVRTATEDGSHGVRGLVTDLLQKALAPGSDADLVIWDPQRKLTYGVAHARHRTDYNLYEGWELVGFPERVYLRGQCIVVGERWLGRAGMGRFLRRAPFAPIL